MTPSSARPVRPPDVRPTVNPCLLPLTPTDLAERWHVAAYTVREWAKAGLIDGAEHVGRHWHFPAVPLLWVRAVEPLPLRDATSHRLRVVAPSPATHALIDLAVFPLTACAVAHRWGKTTATICRWAAAGRISPAVHVHGDWRMGATCTYTHAAAPRGQSPLVETLPVVVPRADELDALRAMNFDALRAAPSVPRGGDSSAARSPARRRQVQKTTVRAARGAGGARSR